MSGIFGMPPAVADGKPGEKLGIVEPQNHTGHARKMPTNRREPPNISNAD